MKRIFVLGLLICIVTAQVAWGEVPPRMSYQGILKDANGKLVDTGDYKLTFKIYDDSTAVTHIWTEFHEHVTVVNGIYNVILGSSKTLNLAFDKPYWLSMSVNDGAELAPRIALTSSPYSLNTRSVSGLYPAKKIYDSQWFAASLSGNYPKSHDLGTTRILTKLYFATDNSGSNMTCVEYSYMSGSSGWNGAQVRDITASTLVVAIGDNQVGFRLVNGVPEWYPSEEFPVFYMRVIAIALE